VRAQRADGFPAPSLFSTADASGNFAFGSVIAPGQISLVTFKSGYDNSRDVVAVPAGGDTSVMLKIQSLLAIADVK
jgi:hypothetical protein